MAVARQPSPNVSVCPVQVEFAVDDPPPTTVVIVYGIAIGAVAAGTGGAGLTVTTIELVDPEPPKFPLAAYVATTLSAPCGRNALKFATPFISVALPIVVGV